MLSTLNSIHSKHLTFGVYPRAGIHCIVLQLRVDEYYWGLELAGLPEVHIQCANNVKSANTYTGDWLLVTKSVHQSTIRLHSPAAREKNDRVLPFHGCDLWIKGVVAWLRDPSLCCQTYEYVIRHLLLFYKQAQLPSDRGSEINLDSPFHICI